MEWKEYLILSEKTLSTEFHNDKKTELLLHAVMGIITELEEIIEWKEDKVGKAEELSDNFWYFSIISREYNIEMPKYEFSEKKYIKINELYDKDVSKIVLLIYRKSSILMDFLKKKLFYNKPLDENKFIDISNQLMMLMLDYAYFNRIDIHDSLDKNIAKLKARYGEKFSSERAINRDTILERNILEGK